MALQPSPTQYHLANNGHLGIDNTSTVPKERERDIGNTRMTVGSEDRVICYIKNNKIVVRKIFKTFKELTWYAR